VSDINAVEDDPFKSLPTNDDGLTPLDAIREIRQLPDGSSIFAVGEETLEDKEQQGEPDFYANLAESMSDAALNNIAADLLDEIKQDLESRQEWEKMVNLSFKYLGLKIDEFRSMPFLQHACSAFDSTLSSSLLRFYSTALA